MPYVNNAAGWKKTATSHGAAQEAARTATGFEARCLEVIGKHGPMTADEAAAALQQSVLTIRPRFTNLRNAGQIADTGQRRKNASGREAIVWGLVQNG